MVELIMRKRRAQPGEIGLFPAGEVFEDQWGAIKADTDVNVQATTTAHGKYMRLSWHIARLICDSSDEFEYTDDAREWLLIHAKHSRKVMDKLRGKAELKAKGTRRLDGTAWLELIPRLVHVATTMYGIPEDAIFTDLSKEEFFRRDEPPPITEIPDGPGHNSGPAGVSRVMPDEVPPNHSYEEAAVAAGEISEMETLSGAMRDKTRPEPPVAPETPSHARQYDLYARYHIDRAEGHQAAMGWLWTPQQAQLRDKLGVPIGARKSLERYCAEKHGGK